jgi:hypothetical protein
MHTDVFKVESDGVKYNRQLAQVDFGYALDIVLQNVTVHDCDLKRPGQREKRG